MWRPRLADGERARLRFAMPVCMSSVSADAVAVAVVARDRDSMFRACIEALYANTEERFRLVVVTAGADEATLGFLRRLAETQADVQLLLDDRPLSQSEARQRALSVITERFCAIVENDTIVHRG